MIPPRPRDSIELTTRDLTVISAPAGSHTPDVIVAIGVHDARHDLAKCLESVSCQDLPDARLGVVVLLDAIRADRWTPRLPTRLAPRTWLLQANCGNAARTRNALIEFIEASLSSCRWIARLDGDDRFAERDSLSAAVDAGDAADACFVLGGNRVLGRDGRTLRINPAQRWLTDRDALLRRLAEMAEGVAENELPSCNLLLRARCGLRYPDVSSAEDHWLVAALLINDADRGVLVESPLFADYSPGGWCTQEALRSQRHAQVRRALHFAARTWLSVANLPGRVLGSGQEGVVRAHEGMVYKHFYPEVLSESKAEWLHRTLGNGQTVAPSTRLVRDDDAWTAAYDSEPTDALFRAERGAAEEFLAECLRIGVVCTNVKRSNFRVRANGRLIYTDIGNSLLPMDVDILRDCAARLFSIGVLGASDEELLRRRADHDRPAIWERLHGFSEFYGGVIRRHIAGNWERALLPPMHVQPRRSWPDATLLIKACAMDADGFRRQGLHLVEQLEGPGRFAERIIAIDPHGGPFLRQHAPGDLPALLAAAKALRAEGIVDRVVVAPSTPSEVAEIHRRWFGIESAASHSAEGVPVAPQLWAFDQVSTRFVLQCDADVLVCRRDRSHDYLGEMIKACWAPGVCGVGLNIPVAPQSAPSPFDAPPGEFKPEVRCGLLDLERIRGLRPLPNRVVSGQLELPWYRSLHERQRAAGCRFLRGGSPATFYIHPVNALKSNQDAIARVRDLIEQGRVPASHWGRWDLTLEGVADWSYPRRSECVVVLARGRNTPRHKIDRFAAGLAIQLDQSFGVVAIDDASDDGLAAEYLRDRLEFLGDRLTLIRHARRRGRMLNNVIANREICGNPDSAILVVDLDDALADPGAIAAIRSLFASGHDVVLAAPFRPDAATKVYRPEFHAPRPKFGGDVWIHLRCYAKRLFDLLPDAALQFDGAWLEECEDYATMIPIVELARSPVYVPEYWCWHERMTGRQPGDRERRDAIIRRILDAAPVANPVSGNDRSRESR